MFTGIIQTIGLVRSVETNGTNHSFWIKSSISADLKVDQSVSHNGVCLTVESVNGDEHRVTAINETLLKTNLGNWAPGTMVNLETCLAINGKLDGHIVQGHVDTVATCTGIIDKTGSREYSFRIPAAFSTLIIEKGSISLNGISLTIFNVTEDGFTVAIIPYTLEHTNMKQLKENDTVNIEFDMIGKYVNRIARFQNKQVNAG
ncbi:MAG: riboflavin synthase [Ferruginibacter sp.]